MRTLQDLIDDAAFVHADAAIALREAVGAVEPVIDVRRGTATFETPSGPMQFGIQLLGSDDSNGPDDLDALFGGHAGGTWEWGWVRPEAVPTRLLELVRFVREVGAREGIAELATPSFPLDQLSPAHVVVAAKGAAARIGSVVVPGAPGVHVHLVLEGVGGGSPAVRHAAEAITNAIEHGLVADHQRALRSYAGIAKLRLVEVPGGAALLHTPDGHLEIHFDADDRILRIEIRERAAARAIGAGPAWNAHGDAAATPAREPRPVRDDAPIAAAPGWLEQHTDAAPQRPPTPPPHPVQQPAAQRPHDAPPPRPQPTHAPPLRPHPTHSPPPRPQPSPGGGAPRPPWVGQPAGTGVRPHHDGPPAWATSGPAQPGPPVAPPRREAPQPPRRDRDEPTVITSMPDDDRPPPRAPQLPPGFGLPPAPRFGEFPGA